MKHTSSIKTYTAGTAKPSLNPPQATVSHFGTSGRILAFYPQVNRNGFTVLKEDVSDDMIKTLVGSTVDLEHVKKGFGVHSMLVPKESNTVCGSIMEAVRTDEGIDISCKLERELVKAFGFTPDDFAPGQGVLSSFSQEMDFSPADGKYIVVDKGDPSKIVASYSYSDGLAAGLPDVDGGVGPSRMVNGKWEYTLLEGNPVFFAAKPLSFVGVGHVAKPADPTALTYKLCANEKGEKKTLGFYPGMDEGPAAPYDMTGLSDMGGYGEDLQGWGADVLTNPDITTASADKYDHESEAMDKKNKDDDFAVNYSCMDFSSVTNGEPNIKQKRLFKIKNDKGDFDRNRLISAYRALTGTRGSTHLTKDLPGPVKAHALALIRQGLKSTKPKVSKENSSMEKTELEVLNEKIAELTAAKKLISSEEHNTVIGARDAAVAEVATLKASISDKDAAIETLKAALAEATTQVEGFKATALASERLAILESEHPFTDDEKKAEGFGDFVKSLASLTVDGLENAKLKRTIAKMQAAAKEAPARVLASVARPQMNPVPATGASTSTEDSLGLGELY